MKTLTLFKKSFKPRGEQRKLSGPHVMRAMLNAARDGFNEKFTHPRSHRRGASIQP